MAAIIRVKRRVDEEPQNAFLLNCKKRKTDESSNNPQHSSLLSNSCETSTILKFAGTVDSQDDSITSHISKLTKEEARSIVTKNRVPENSTNRCREETKLNSQENRFKIVNCYRASDQRHGEESKNITVVDVESNAPAQEVPAATTSSSSTATSSTQNDAPSLSNSFVYDLYLPDTNDLTEMDADLVNDLLRITPFNDDLYAGRCNGIPSSDDESEDSNDENNYRNEYPDTEDESVGDDDMRRAVYDDLNIDLNRPLDSDDLSTDDDYLSNYGDDVETRYGRAYAQYKKRVFNKTYSSDDDSNFDDVSNDEDSD